MNELHFVSKGKIAWLPVAFEIIYFIMDASLKKQNWKKISASSLWWSFDLQAREDIVYKILQLPLISKTLS